MEVSYLCVTNVLSVVKGVPEKKDATWIQKDNIAKSVLIEY